MKSKALFPLAAFLLAALANSASALSPSVSFWSDGLRETVDIPIYEDANGIYRVDNWEYSTRDFSIRIHDVALDPDPSISYGIGIVDFGAPSAFSFLFGTPIVPTGSPNVVVGSVVGGLTDFTGDGVAVIPLGASLQQSSVGFPNTNVGVDVGSAFSSGPGVPGALYAYGPHSAGPIAGPGPGPWTFLTTECSFSLSGNNDVFALTGFTSIEEAAQPIPEPSALALLGAGLLSVGLAGWRRTRRSSAR